MRISKILYVLIAIGLFSSCGIERMATKYSTVKFTTTPPILQAHAGKVTLSLDANFPEKNFAKNYLKNLLLVDDLLYANLRMLHNSNFHHIKNQLIDSSKVIKKM